MMKVKGKVKKSCGKSYVPTFISQEFTNDCRCFWLFVVFEFMRIN